MPDNHGASFSIPLAASAATPVYRQVFTWIILWPLLYLVADSALSIFSETNSALMTNDGALLKVNSGFRPQVVLSVLTFAGFAAIGHRKIWQVAINNRLLAFTPILAALSALWSYTPMTTLRMSVEFALMTLFAFYLTELFSPEQFINLLMLVATVAAAASVFLALFLPEYGIYHRDDSNAWQGICSHKNFLGISMLFLLTTVFFGRKPLILKVALGSVLLFLIVMSQSRSAWLETIGTLCFIPWLFIFRRLKAKEALVFVVGTALTIVTIVTIALINLDPLMRSLGKDPTLTGRVGIYLAVLDSIFKQPLLGYGFGGFWLGMNPESFNLALSIHWLTIGYAENGFLELWLELGAVGLVLSLVIFGRALWQSAQLIRGGYYTPRVGWFTTIIVVELLTNIDGGVVMTAPNQINWTLTLVAAVGLATEARRMKQSKNFLVLPTAQQETRAFASQASLA